MACHRRLAAVRVTCSISESEQSSIPVARALASAAAAALAFGAFTGGSCGRKQATAVGFATILSGQVNSLTRSGFGRDLGGRAISSVMGRRGACTGDQPGVQPGQPFRSIQQSSHPRRDLKSRLKL